MQTNFTLAQLADPDTARSEHILRKCVHCGFCTATCPTFVLLGDERDSPRGRIYMIKAMLIRAPAATRAAVDVFSPQQPGLASLTKRVKHGFDPNGVLNPGRMWAGV